MKTKIEFGEYVVEVEEIDGVITVKAEKDDEVVEEFAIETEESQDQAQGQSQDDEDVQGFDDFDKEEDDFEGEEAQEESEKDEEAQELPALESFAAFSQRKK